MKTEQEAKQLTKSRKLVCLYVDKDNIINTFRNISWAPVYLEAREMDLKGGDILKVDCIRKMSQNQMNPDYFLECTV